jgi:polyhydroxyalkanoate synthesis repressor PhaR
METTTDTNKTLSFKRYQNRKIYSLDQSRYVTTRELGDLVRQGRQVQVVDRTGKDITGIVLGSVIAQMQEKAETATSTTMLASLIRGGSLNGTDGV